MGESSDDEEALSYFRKVLDAIEQDNKDEFVSFINRLSTDDEEDAEDIMLKICSYDAANCLAAIFDGEVCDHSLLITYYLHDLEKDIPLHEAARRATPRIAKLLLDKEFSADLRADFDSPYISLKNALPLNVSLDYSRFCLWSCYCSMSPTHQIIRRCKLSSRPNIIRVIARNTKEIKHEFFKYLKQGKVFEVGSLLAIASDLIMSSASTVDGDYGSIGFKNIMEMHQFLLTEMIWTMDSTQLKEMGKTLRLLEIFDRVGDKLVAHMPMWDDDDYTGENPGIKVASLIEDAAYDEEEEVEYDHDAVPSAYYTSSETSLPYVIKSQNPNCNL